MAIIDLQANDQIKDKYIKGNGWRKIFQIQSYYLEIHFRIPTTCLDKIFKEELSEIKVKGKFIGW